MRFLTNMFGEIRIDFLEMFGRDIGHGIMEYRACEGGKEPSFSWRHRKAETRLHTGSPIIISCLSPPSEGDKKNKRCSWNLRKIRT